MALFMSNDQRFVKCVRGQWAIKISVARESLAVVVDGALEKR